VKERLIIRRIYANPSSWFCWFYLIARPVDTVDFSLLC